MNWPQYDPPLITDQEVEIIIQINGKIKERLKVPSGLSKPELERLALDNPTIASMLDGQTPQQVVVVPDRLVNIVS